MQPPPFPPLPSDVETLPGLDQGERIGRLVQEITRLRRERNEALLKLDAATISLVPPPPRKPLPLRLGKYAAELTVLALALRAVVGRYWPAYAELVDWALGGFGL